MEKNHIYSKRRDFACSECDKKFPSQPELKKHMIMHTGIKENVCRICQARYAHLSGLNHHFKVNHAGHLPFHCKQCNFFAANIQIFKNHKNSLVHLQSSAISLERSDPTKLQMTRKTQECPKYILPYAPYMDQLNGAISCIFSCLFC